MNSLKTKAILLALICLIAHQDIFSQGTGNKYAGEFLAIGVGGRPRGMGGAYVALVNDVTAGYWNPGSLSDIKYPQFALMHESQFSNLLNYDYGSVAIPFGKSTSLGFSMIRLGVDDIADTRNALIEENGNGVYEQELGERLDPSKITYFNAADYAFFLTYSKRPSEKFSYGANLKVITKSLAEESAWGLGFDLGVAYNPFGTFFSLVLISWILLLLIYHGQPVSRKLLFLLLRSGELTNLNLQAVLLLPLLILTLDLRTDNRALMQI